MKKVMKAVAALMLMTAVVGCKKPDEPNNETLLPQVKTTEVMDISTTSAICGGEIISNGDGTIIECGVCWSTKAEPSINDNYVIAQTTTGSFTILLDSLSSNTTYTVRAYAKNEAGIGYGNQVSFTTLSNSGGVNTPIGAIGGIYRIGDTDRVYFSQGNLQYQASTNTWRFAENQWDFVGEGLEFGNVFENGVKCDNELIAPDYNGWIDLFGWGTSGYDHGAVCYQP